MDTLKSYISAFIGMAGAAVANAFGGWTQAMETLIIFMAIDYATGLTVAGVFHKSGKSKDGTLSSRAGWRGLAKKCVNLAFVLIAYRLDMLIGTAYIKDAVIIGFCFNELISIVENAGLMGVPLPGVIKQAMDLLHTKVDSFGNDAGKKEDDHEDRT